MEVEEGFAQYDDMPGDLRGSSNNNNNTNFNNSNKTSDVTFSFF
jgi:hypothetical protein